MNFDGIKLTINFRNNQDKENFYKFVKNYLGIEETYRKFSDGQFTKNKKNLKFVSYRLSPKFDKSIKKNSFKQYGFCDINIKTLGPIILSIKETDNKYITLNFKNISNQVKLDESFLSQEQIDFFDEYYTNTKELTKRKLTILDKVFEYIFNNNLHFHTKIKEVNFSHYDFSEDKYKIFNETKRKFINSDCTLDIKKHFFDYQIIYNIKKDSDNKIQASSTNILNTGNLFHNKFPEITTRMKLNQINLVKIENEEDYLNIYSSLLSYENDELIVSEYDTFDRFRFITTNKNQKTLKIANQEYDFKPLIDKESSYIQINKFLEEKIKFKNKRLKETISFPIKPFQLIKVRVSGWFTQNKAILLSKNESTKYYYRLSDSIEEINQHINQFLKKYTLYKIQNNQIDEEIIDEEDYSYHREREYDCMVEDTSSGEIIDDNFDSEMSLEKLIEELNYDYKKDKLEEIKNLSPTEMINTDIKFNKTIIKKFEKYEDVEKIDFFNSLRFLSNMLSKYKK